MASRPDRPISMAVGVPLIGIGVVAIAFSSIFIRLCDDMPALIIAAGRMVVASALLAPLVAVRGLGPGRIRRRDGLLLLACGLFLALHFIAWIHSLKYTSVASSVVLVTTNPVWVGLFGLLFRGERQTPALTAGIVLSVAGGCVLAFGDGRPAGSFPHALLGDGLALAGALFASGYLVTAGIVRERIGLLPFVFIVYASAAVALALAVAATGLPAAGYRPSSYLYLILLAVVSQLAGHTIFDWALGHLRASMVAITILGEAVGAALLAWWLFAEPVGPVQGLGMAMILAAIAIASSSGVRMRE